MLLRYVSDPFKALTGAFFARFFESEITTGYDDLKSSFFWLLAALAVPGMFIPWLMVFDWQGIAIFKGPIALREASQAEKVFYLGFSMIASGLLTTIVWSSLLPDRRDTLILGGLPVESRTIVAAKLVALFGYILLIAIAMHAVGAVFFGSILATNSGALFAVRGIVAHFVAAAAASASVALMVAAAQGLTLALVGPRLFVRVTIVLQACLVALMALGLALLPYMTFSVVHTVRGFGGNLRPWVLSTPPVWFLGVYEWVLGTGNPVLLGLALKAALALAIAACVIVMTYPIAYRRLMVSVVERGRQPGGALIMRLIRTLLIGVSGRHPDARAAADFYLATIARVERHRFVLAMAFGIATAWVVIGSNLMDPPEAPQAAWFGLPLSAMIFLTAGLRLAASLPGDVRGGWLFELEEPSRAHARQAVERLMFVLGVLPPVVISAAAFWWMWGRDVALTHGAISLALGAAVVEFLLRRYEGMPCGQRWTLAGATLGYRWPFHVAGFFLITIGVPGLEMLLFGHPYLAGAFAAIWIILAAALRHASITHVVLPSYDEVDPAAGVLRLN
jgi:hypothetical protein